MCFSSCKCTWFAEGNKIEVGIVVPGSIQQISISTGGNPKDKA